MTGMTKKHEIIALLLNISVAVMEIPAFRLSLLRNGKSLIQFYTEDSNLLAGISCIVMAVFLIRKISGGAAVPNWAGILKYMSVCCLTLTFLVVIFVLGPMTGSSNGFLSFLFKNSMLYQHFLCPIVLFISFMFFENDFALEKRHIKFAMMPTLLYASVILVLNITRSVTGPYPFLYIYDQPVWASVLWLAVIIGSSFLIALLIIKLYIAMRSRLSSPNRIP